MDAFILFSPSQDIVSDEAESLEIEELRRIDGYSVSAEIITQIYSPGYLFIIEVIRCLDDFDRKFVCLGKLLYIIYFPGIEIFPDSEVDAVKSCFFDKFEYQIQPISRKRIRTE